MAAGLSLLKPRSFISLTNSARVSMETPETDSGRANTKFYYCKLQLAASHRALPSDWRIRKGSECPQTLPELIERSGPSDYCYWPETTLPTTPPLPARFRTYLASR